MNHREYKRLTLAEMQQRRWRTTKRLERRDGSAIAAGTEVKIVDKRGGLNIVMLPCQHCGAELHVRKVHPNDVEEIPDG